MKLGLFVLICVTFVLLGCSGGSTISHISVIGSAETKIGGVSVQGVSYQHSRRIEFERKTRTKALLEAKEKAKNMAATLGLVLGDPLKIIDIDRYGVAGRGFLEGDKRNKFGNLRESGSEPVSADILVPGKITIRMVVDVSFEMG